MSPAVWLAIAVLYGASAAVGLLPTDVTSPASSDCSRPGGGRSRSLLLLPQDDGIFQPCDSYCQQQQRAALLQLFTNTHGQGWHNASGWGTSAHHCTWFGVICCSTNSSTLPTNGLGMAAINYMGGATVQSRLRLTCTPLNSMQPLADYNNISSLQPSVVALSLIGNGLAGGLASLFVLATLGGTLQALELPSNALNGSLALPAVISSNGRKLSALLRYLALDNNHFVGPLPPWIEGMGSLRHLSLSSNALTGTVS